MSRILSSVLLAVVLQAMLAQAASAQNWVQWPGNGHLYAVIVEPQGISWTAADTAARALEGQLASITSAAENDFVFSLIDAPEYWHGHLSFTGVEFNVGPWIGGHQPDESPEPNGGWVWTTGETFDFNGWLIGEPNNGPIPGELTENRTCFWVRGSLTDRDSTWNDYHDGGCWDGDCVIAYVVERTCPLLTAEGPLPQSVCAGGAATFTVAPSGAGPFTYAWRKGDQPLVDDLHITGSDAPTLAITGATAADADDYSCVISDACGPVTSAAAMLNVFASGSGDGDGSGTVDGLDIAGFVIAATNPTAATTAYCVFDMNTDGTVNADDLPAFIALLVQE